MVLGVRREHTLSLLDSGVHPPVHTHLFVTVAVEVRERVFVEVCVMADDLEGVWVAAAVLVSDCDPDADELADADILDVCVAADEPDGVETGVTDRVAVPVFVTEGGLDGERDVVGVVVRGGDTVGEDVAPREPDALALDDGDAETEAVAVTGADTDDVGVLGGVCVLVRVLVRVPELVRVSTVGRGGDRAGQERTMANNGRGECSAANVQFHCYGCVCVCVDSLLGVFVLEPVTVEEGVTDAVGLFELDALIVGVGDAASHADTTGGSDTPRKLLNDAGVATLVCTPVDVTTRTSFDGIVAYSTKPEPASVRPAMEYTAADESMDTVPAADHEVAGFV